MLSLRVLIADDQALVRAGLASIVGSEPGILTTFGDDEYVYAALTAGASGFLLKNAPPEQLIDRAQAVVAAYESGLVEPGAQTRKRWPSYGGQLPDLVAGLDSDMGSR